MNMPRLQAHELNILMHHFPPRNLQSIILVRDTVLSYASTYPKTVAAALLMLYVIMQTFAIPGTISLSLLCGALYGSTRGFFLIALISTLGSTACYCMSWCFGRPIAHAIWKGKLDEFSAQIAKRKNDLLNYIIFLRVTPILPNTFINVASPIVGVPLYHFIVGTLLGCLPNNFMAANAGDHLSDLDELSDLYSPRMLVTGLLAGFIALIPVFVKHRQEKAEAARRTA
eukprot:jgi/Chrzof1/7552/Cz02g28050.t1